MKFSFVGMIDESLREGTVVELICAALSVLTLSLNHILCVEVIRLCTCVCYRCVTFSMSLSACNSAGHLSNHADIAPHYAGVTFAISNTMVSKTYVNFPLVWNVGMELGY